MDSDVLIKIAKASVKDMIVSNMDVSVPMEVKREAVDEGKAGGYPDAILIEENIKKGKLKVVAAQPNEATENLIESLNLLGGEADSLRLYKEGNHDAIASDDQKFLDLVDGLGIPFVTPAALLLYLWKSGKTSKDETRKCIERIRGLIGLEEYLISVEELGGGE